MAGSQLWCRVRIFGPDDNQLAECVLEGSGAPDLRALDELARLALVAVRLDGRVILAEVAPAMQELLQLAGLGIEVGGQAE
jgi:hypothetical protein